MDLWLLNACGGLNSCHFNLKITSRRTEILLKYTCEHVLTPYVHQCILLIISPFATSPVSAHPNVQKVALVSSASDAPLRGPEISVPADLDKTITELADWLVLIDQMLKSNIVTVGDVKEINKTVSRMKVGAECEGSPGWCPLLGSLLFILNLGKTSFAVFFLRQAAIQG